MYVDATAGSLAVCTFTLWFADEEERGDERADDGSEKRQTITNEHLVDISRQSVH